MRMMVVLFLFCGITLASLPASAATYYIDDDGTDNGDTSPCTDVGAPCLTWDYTVSKASCSDTIVVIDGSTFDETIDLQGTVSDTNCGNAVTSVNISLSLPDKGCSSANPITIEPQTVVPVTPEGWKDIDDEVPSWEINNRGSGEGCIAVLGTSGDRNGGWIVKGFECNTDMGLAVCYADDVTFSDFIVDVESTGTVNYYNTDGQKRTFRIYESTDVLWDNFRYRPTIQNFAAGTGYLETPAFTKPQGPGTSTAGQGGTRAGGIVASTNVTFSDFDFPPWPYGMPIAANTGVTMKRGSFGGFWGHGVEFDDLNDTVLAENIVIYQPQFGHCWDGSLSEATVEARLTKQATITSKRCFVDADCSGEGASDVCRTDDYDCDQSLSSRVGVATPLEGICGICPLDQKTCASGDDWGLTCTTSGDCAGGAACSVHNQTCGGPMTGGDLTYYDGSNMTFRNITMLMRTQARQHGWGTGYNLTSPVSNASAPDRCGTEPGTGILESLCRGSVPTINYACTSDADCEGTCNNPGTLLCVGGYNDGNSCVIDADCETTCWNACVAENIKFYNNVVQGPGNEELGIGARSLFVKLFDSKYMKYGPGDQVGLDCNLYSKINPSIVGESHGSSDYNYPSWECGFNYPFNDNIMGSGVSLSDWQTTNCSGARDQWGTRDDPEPCTKGGTAGLSTTCDRPITLMDGNSTYVADITGTGYFADFDAADYTPGATLLDSNGPSCIGNSTLR